MAERSAAVVTSSQSLTPSPNGSRAQETPHLLTPLATVWPAATPSEPPKALEKAQVAEKSPAAAALQTVKVNFVLLDLGAKQVSLSGDFNGWSADATPMKRGEGGYWQATVALVPGRYEYKFVVDKQWIPDPLAREQVWNYHGTLNSVIEVRS